MAQQARVSGPLGAPAGLAVEAPPLPRLADDHPGGFDPVGVLRTALQEAVGVSMRPRWSARRTVAFAIVVCGAFWGLVAFVVAWLQG